MRLLPQRSAANSTGFTLVEVLIALLLMSTLALLSWRAMDNFSRLKEANHERSINNFVLQTALNQWRVDLDAISSRTDKPTSLDFDGKVLRLVRLNRSGDQNGFLVVAWSIRDDNGISYWYRWQSPILLKYNDLDSAWQQARIWAYSPTQDLIKYETKIIPLADWHIYFFIGNSWVNPQSKQAIDEINNQQYPDGIRLQLDFPGNYVFEDNIVKDWLNPRFKMVP